MKGIAQLREKVFERDSEQCRICEAVGMPQAFRGFFPLELAHLKAKGIGGDHEERTVSTNLIVACREHHQGPRSLHSGHIKWRFLTEDGADGPMAFEFVEQLPKTLWKGRV